MGTFPLCRQGRSRGLDTALLCVLVHILLQSCLTTSTVPFLIMGRVTYVHHYVREIV